MWKKAMGVIIATYALRDSSEVHQRSAVTAV
jgi:hypothetical protein